ncbi:hypothetical protein GKQ38_01065 [Candidatus Nanohaloarchaea archaeon]|nr:hypothetical protein GKQ38_01065 [Candidatus Nanohaloarchaea archaeon]
MKKALLLIITIFLISITAAFPASLKVVDRTASPDEPANFQVEIKNNYSTEQSFRVSPHAGNLDWFFNDGPITLDPSENGTINITVTPSVNSYPHNWQFDLRVWMTGTNRFEMLSSYYRVERRAELEVVSTGLQKKFVKPGHENSLNITVRNLGTESLEDYSFVLSYMNRAVERGGETLLPGTDQRMPGQKTYSFNLEVPEGTPPGNITPVLKVVYDNKTRVYNYSFHVEKVTNVFRLQNGTDGAWGFTKELYAENRGNTKVNVTFDETVPVYVTPFVAYSAEPDEVVHSQSKATYVWKYALSPGEEATVQYSVNYWMPALIVLLIVAGLVALKRLGSTATITKTARKEDGMVKVGIEVKNNSDRVLSDLAVVDFVPDIASVSQNFNVATPEIHRTGEGTKLEWRIDSLRPGEERVYEYRIKPKVEVEGGATLQPAEIKKGEETLALSSERSVEFSPE